jgi:hypothetical protein
MKSTTSKETTMNVEIIRDNEWAKKMTSGEVANWIEAMLECGRTEAIGFWTGFRLVRCPNNKPLAIV